MLRSGGLLLFVLLASGLIGASPVEGGEAKINDWGLFFSDTAVRQAKRTMDEINQRYKVDVVIDTYASIPDDLRSQYDKTDKNFFRRWARRLAADGGVKGIYLLICKDPPHITVEPDDSVARNGLRRLIARNSRRPRRATSARSRTTWPSRKPSISSKGNSKRTPVPVAERYRPCRDLRLRARANSPSPHRALSLCRNSPAVLDLCWWA